MVSVWMIQAPSSSDLEGGECLMVCRFALDDRLKSSRICPGRHFADASAWLLVSNVLAVFNVLPQVNPETGEEVLPEVKYTSGFAR